MMSRPAFAAAALLAVAACGGSSPSSPADVAPASVAAALAAAAPQPSPSAAPPEEPGPIAYVRVAFYGIQCPRGRKAPNNGARQLPVGCTGFVTATPKQGDGTDVKARDHGPNIAWELAHGEIQVKVVNDLEQPFNKQLKGRVPGPFMLCATVKTVRGCLGGEVVP